MGSVAIQGVYTLLEYLEQNNGHIHRKVKKKTPREEKKENTIIVHNMTQL